MTRHQVVVLVIMMVSAGLACAQDCSLSPNFCTRLNPGMVVFIGLETSREKAKDSMFGPTTVTTFTVQEVLWGLDNDTKAVRVRLFAGEESSSLPVFVAASRGDDGEYFVDYCGGGLKLPVDDPWAQQFRTYLKDSKRAELLVRVVAVPGYSPLAATQVTMQGPLGTIKGKTDNSGEIKFSTVMPGSYSLAASKRDYSLAPGGGSVSILPGSCAPLLIRLRSSSHVSGQILDSSGRPQGKAGGFYLVAWSDSNDAQDYRRSRPIEIDDQGRFTIDGVEPGRYYLGSNIWETREPRQGIFPRTYYPGVKDRASAQPLVIQSGKSLEDIVFRLPDYGKKRKLTVRVTSADGMPVAHAIVEDGPAEMNETDVAGIGPGHFTDDQGVVILEVWAASDYSIDARLVVPKAFYESEPIPIPAGEENTETNIVLENLKLREP